MQKYSGKLRHWVHFAAYLGLIAAAVTAGSQLTALILSIFNPELAGKFYYVDPAWFGPHRDGTHRLLYFSSLAVGASLAKAWAWLIIIPIFSKWDARQPFTSPVIERLRSLSQAFLTVALLTILANMYGEWLGHRGLMNFTKLSGAEEYLFLAGLVYLLSQAFRQGQLLQEENQLTV